MLSNAIGQKVICSYRNNTQIWVGVVLAPITIIDESRSMFSEAHWCEVGNKTPVQYPFGKMLDSDASLTIIEEAK